MDFSDALKAMKEGKKIRRSKWINKPYLIIGNREQYGLNKLLLYLDGDSSHLKQYYIQTEDILADDWEIVEDIPEVKLFRSKDIYFICPKCQSQQEQLVYTEDRPEEIHECRFCGQKFKFENLEEMKKMYYGGEDSNTNIKVVGSPKINTNNYKQDMNPIQAYFLLEPPTYMDIKTKEEAKKLAILLFGDIETIPGITHGEVLIKVPNHYTRIIEF